jgi:glycosyltransferase involved in cell wall biosynthesis
MDVSIGIPSYNEERSIANILKAIEIQVSKYGNRCNISEVIISDDSTDSTVDIIKDYSSKSILNIILIHHDKRRGAATAWNEILHKAKGDAIILYDADIIPAPDTTKILADAISEGYSLCAAGIRPVRCTGIAGRASMFTASWLRRMRLQGINQYTIMGRALALAGKVAKHVTIPTDTIAIDLYLQCRVMEMGYRIEYRDDAIVYFKPVGSIKELVMQTSRALQGHRELAYYIDRLNLRASMSSMLKALIQSSIENPLGLASLIPVYMLYPFYSKSDSSRWRVAESSKGLSIDDVMIINGYEDKTRYH